MKTTILNDFAAIFAAIGLATACGGKGGYSSSRSSHWVCQMPQDCSGVPGAVACQNGYCVDSAGMRIVNEGAGGTNQTGTGTGGGAGTAATLPAGCPAMRPADGGVCEEARLVCLYPGESEPDGDEWHYSFTCVPNSRVSNWVMNTHVESHVCMIDPAAGRDLSIDDCAERTEEPCVVVSPDTAQQHLDSQVATVFMSCAPGLDQWGFEVEFQNGCPTKMLLHGASATDPVDAIYTCAGERFATTRYACAADLACARGGSLFF